MQSRSQRLHSSQVVPQRIISFQLARWLACFGVAHWTGILKVPTPTSSSFMCSDLNHLSLCTSPNLYRNLSQALFVNWDVQPHILTGLWSAKAIFMCQIISSWPARSWLNIGTHVTCMLSWRKSIRTTRHGRDVRKNFDNGTRMMMVRL